jgi:hypothetical protein
VCEDDLESQTILAEARYGMKQLNDELITVWLLIFTLLECDLNWFTDQLFLS